MLVTSGGMGAEMLRVNLKQNSEENKGVKGWEAIQFNVGTMEFF